MSKRWARWIGGGILVVLLAWFGWRVSIKIPEGLRVLEGEIVSAAAQYGLEVRHGGLKFHLLHLYLSLDDLEVRDAAADRFLGRAGDVEISLSPLRLLRGQVPVSRIRVRNFRVEAGERNRALYEKFVSSKKGGGGTLPEILFVDGSVLLGPLGPVHRLEAEIRELRIREGRFLGTRIHASIARTTGTISVAGQESAAWPFTNLEADLVRKGNVIKVRRARAWGAASTVRISGFLETGERLVEGRAYGEVDIKKWVDGSFPGAVFARRTVRGGKVEFSASVAGPWNNPDGSAKIVLRDGDFQGTAVSDAEAAFSVKGRTVRLDRARAKLLGGVVDAEGSYGVDSAMVEGKGSFRRFSLASVPWPDLGVPLRLAGTADLDVSVSGTPERLQGDLSLSLPEGVERLPYKDQGAFKVRVPLSANVSAGLSGNRTLHLETVRLRAGRAEVRGSGEIPLSGPTLRLGGTLQVPAGKLSEYGFEHPVSWGGAAGEWEVSGPVDRPRTTLSLRISM
ncbi:MAG: hypothetical protein H6Q84_1810, partial [Deltaproteobacteria bacterium]|nr:hypothetical protein [Deltaproteobacteria bacterium]